MSTSEKQQLDLLLTQRTGLKLPNIYVSIFCILGVDEVNNKTMPPKEALKDDTRISYYRAHLHAMLSAIREGGKRERVLHVVAAGQLRVGERLHCPVRDIFRRLQQRVEAVPQEICPLVQRVPQEVNMNVMHWDK